MTSRWWPRAAPARSSRRRSRSRWGRRTSSSRRIRASRRPWACSPPTWSTSTWRPRTSAFRRWTRARSRPASRSSRRRPAASSKRTGSRQDRLVVQRVVDARYTGQGYELRVEVGSGEIDEAWAEKLRADFHDIHEREYSRRFEESDIEIPNIRVRGIGLMPPLEDVEVERGDEKPPEDALRYEGLRGSGCRESCSRSRPATTTAPPCMRATASQGPAIVHQYDSTTVIPPGLAASVDGSRQHRHRDRRRRPGRGPRSRRGSGGLDVRDGVRGRSPAGPARRASGWRSTRSRSASSAVRSTPSPRRWRACSSA